MLHEENELVAERRKKLTKQGPMIRVKLGRPRGMAMPVDTIEMDALIDTGACSIFVKNGIPAQLGLKAVGSVKVATPSHVDNRCQTYRVVLMLSDSFYVEVEAVEMPLPDQDYDCIIGRSLLKHARFIYDGFTGTFSLDF
jgi:Retroviral aspartyl protease